MPQPKNYYSLGRRLTMRYPELAILLLKEDPEPVNISGKIPFYYRRFLNLIEQKQTEINISRLEFVAIIVKFADPESLTTTKKLRPGIRSELAELFHCDNSQISHILRTAKSYLKIYVDFRERIDYLYMVMFEASQHVTPWKNNLRRFTPHLRLSKNDSWACQGRQGATKPGGGTDPEGDQRNGSKRGNAWSGIGLKKPAHNAGFLFSETEDFNLKNYLVCKLCANDQKKAPKKLILSASISIRSEGGAWSRDLMIMNHNKLIFRYFRAFLRTSVITW